ncbi:TetR/AcrR family transcriptional regulator [Gordonia alkaliphila]|uniref:TetR/AcrR family transcriptional regulator n=1 Tax=Gordonia alkaliphila TaxID=1053547 RepID=UPI001FF6099F|nr:TetR/AcrR family transcriptional regulator [Gordonia alkaliphila]MCK0440477.1 TetR/AcrR family transcriptional regulator [Gordonia alkaliphila]
MTENTSKAQQTRARLLDAAVTAFADRGFHGTTTRDLAAAAGMSPAAVYVHYPSKEDLLYQLSLGGHRDTLAVVDEYDDPELAPAARLHRLIRGFSRHHAENHTTARVVNYELASLSPEHYTEIRQLRREIARRMRAVVDAGMASGDFATSDPRAVTLALLSMNIDIARWYDEGGSLSPEALSDAYADLALRMVEAAGRHSRTDPGTM